MDYDVYTNLWDICLTNKGMSYTITWVFGLAACPGLYGIQIIFGHDKDYSDASCT
jgi:hypothetical protein